MFTLNRILWLFPLLFAGCSEAGVSEVEIAKAFSVKTEVATFSGGSFRYLEAPFESLEGIISVYSGYAGLKGEKPAPTEANPEHKEAVQITFNPDVISYSELLDIYWQLFDPTDSEGSFQDRGSQNQSAIFYHSARQKSVAESSKKTLNNSGIFNLPVVTAIVKYPGFSKAEDLHQDDYLKDPEKHKASKSRRERFIADHWKIPSADRYAAPTKAALQQQLTELQYEVTQEGVTEPAFHNLYDGNKKKGIYTCVVSGAPLFSSKDKFDSKTGWPSFTKPIDARFLTKKIDHSHGMIRVEVRSKFGDAHGGHVFNDGPAPTRLRYCMNSASLKFIPEENMEKLGYGNYLWLVE